MKKFITATITGLTGTTLDIINEANREILPDLISDILGILKHIFLQQQ